MIATPKSSSRAYRLSNRLEIQQNSTQKSTAEKKCMERQPTVQLIQFHQQIIRDDKESQNHVKHLVDHSGSIDRHRCIDQQTNLEKYRTNSQPPYHRPPPPSPSCSPRILNEILSEWRQPSDERIPSRKEKKKIPDDANQKNRKRIAGNEDDVNL